MTTVIETTVIKRFKPFVLGYCKCGCNEEIKVIQGHYLKRFKMNHDKRLRTREKSSNWKGGRVYDDDGYILVNKPNHPFANNARQVREHRLVYEHYLKILFDEDIYIPRETDIDHINEQKDDNRLINLRPVTHGQNVSIYYANRRMERGLRYCLDCESNSTYVFKDGRPNWYNKGNGKFQCTRCYKREKRSNGSKW